MSGQRSIIIGIAGKAGSGKTTLANFLKTEFENRQRKACIINYGDLVKFIAKEYFNWSGEKDEIGRSLLQKVGTEYGRNKTDENIWTDIVIKCSGVLENEYNVIIVADCRFPNEIERWEKLGKEMISIKIIRGEYENNLTQEQKAHASETALDSYLNFTYTVENLGGLNEFKDAAKAIVKDILY